MKRWLALFFAVLLVSVPLLHAWHLDGNTVSLKRELRSDFVQTEQAQRVFLAGPELPPDANSAFVFISRV